MTLCRPIQMPVAALALLRALLLCAAVTTGLMLPAGPASAHSSLISSTPDNGQVLQEAPRSLTLQFTDPISAGLVNIRVVGPRHAEVPIGRVTHASGDPATIRVPLTGTVTNGRYRVAWRVVSADSHPIEGAFTFRVEAPTATTTQSATPVPGAGAPATEAPLAAPPSAAELPAASEGVWGATAWYGVARWSAFVFFGLLVGPLFLVLLCWPTGVTTAGVRRLVWTGWTGLLASTVLTLLSYGAHVTGRPAGAMLDPGLIGATLHERAGLALTIRLILLLLLAGLLAGVLLRPRPSELAARLWAAGVLGGGAALAVTWSMATHSGTGPGSVVAMPVDVIHLVAMAVWIGGLALLGTVILPGRDDAVARAVLPGFSRSAAICVAALITTGSVQAWRQVRTVPALLGTDYGHLLLVKLGLAVLLITAGAAGRLWVRTHYNLASAGPGDRPRTRRPTRKPHVTRLRRSVAAETALAMLVLGITTALVATEPARIASASRHEREDRAPVVAPTVAAPETGPAAAPSDEPDSSASRAATAPAAVPYDAGGGPSGRGWILVQSQPAGPGRAIVHLAVLTHAGKPRAVRTLRLSLRRPGSDAPTVRADLLAAGPGHYTGLVSLPTPGRWEAQVSLRTSKERPTTVVSGFGLSA